MTLDRFVDAFQMQALREFLCKTLLASFNVRMLAILNVKFACKSYIIKTFGRVRSDFVCTGVATAAETAALKYYADQDLFLMTL